MTARRFPPPWSVEETAACFIVRDNGGQQLAYVDAGFNDPAAPLRAGIRIADLKAATVPRLDYLSFDQFLFSIHLL